MNEPQTAAEIVAGYKQARARMLAAGLAHDFRMAAERKLAAPAISGTTADIPRLISLQDKRNAQRKRIIAEEFVLVSWRGLAIIKAVSEFSRVSRDDLTGPSRMMHFVYWRQLAISLIKKHTDLSLTQIGRMFHLHHSTVLYSIRRSARRSSAEHIASIEKLWEA